MKPKRIAKMPVMAREMSQRELAKKVGISESYLSLILYGKRTPSNKIAAKLLKHGLAIQMKK